MGVNVVQPLPIHRQKQSRYRPQRMRIELHVAASRAQDLEQRRIAPDRSVVPSTGTSSVRRR